MQIDSSLIKSFAVQGFKTLLLIIVLSGFGIVLNWILLAFLTPELVSLFDLSAGRASHAGGPAVVLALLLLVIANWQASLIFLIFFLVFPILHFIFAKKYAITKAIYSILADRKTQFVEYLLGNFFRKLEISGEEKVNSSNSLQKIKEQLPLYLKKLDGIPFTIRIIIKYFLSKLNFLNIAVSVINEQGQVSIRNEYLVSKISNKLNETLDEKFLSPSFFENVILIIVNLVLFIALKVTI